MYTVYTNGHTKRDTYISENSARHNAIKYMGNVFINEVMVIEDATGEIVYEVKRITTINRKRG